MTEDQDWAIFKQKLKAQTEIDLDLYKEPQMKHRIKNLIQNAGFDSYVQYFDYVYLNQDRLAAFLENLTVNVSEFFRTPERFNKLEKNVIPKLLRRSSKLNIWSAGCSSGAEPYTLSIIMKELTPSVRHRILASDLHAEILAKAKCGSYTANEKKSMSPERRRKYFDEDGDFFAVKEEIKNAIEFRRHDLLKDQFEHGFDLILCRNVMIYFTDEMRDRIYHYFFEALNPGGILFVGATESILNFRRIGYTRFQPFFYQRPLVK